MNKGRQLKIQGSVATLIPIIFFLLLTFSAGGGGSDNVLRAIPIAGLVAVAWFRPQVGGWALIILGLGFAGLYGFTVRDTLELLPSIAVALIFFVPIVGAGYLFLRAHKQSAAE